MEGSNQHHDERSHIGDAVHIEDDALAMSRVKQQADRRRGSIDMRYRRQMGDRPIVLASSAQCYRRNRFERWARPRHGLKGR